MLLLSPARTNSGCHYRCISPPPIYTPQMDFCGCHICHFFPLFDVFRLINDSTNLTGVWQIMSIDCNRNSGVIQNAHICLRKKWEKRTLFQTHQREYIEHYIRKPEGVCISLARHNKRNGKSNRTFKNKTFFWDNRYGIHDNVHNYRASSR